MESGWLFHNSNYFLYAFRVGDWHGFESYILHNKYIQCVFTMSSLPGFCFQWVDCVSQLLRMYPFAFEFSAVCILDTSVFVLLYNILCLFHAGNFYYFIVQAFLVDFLDCMLSCRFGNFFFNRYLFLLTTVFPWIHLVFGMHFPDMAFSFCS